MTQLMNIGEAASAAGVSAKMIRHYEQIGLMPPATRTEAGYRLYSTRDVSVLCFIRQSRGLGFSMKQIGDLIGLWRNDHRSSREVKALAQTHLVDLEEKLREIASMKAGLERVVAACRGDDHPHCAILENLAVDSDTPPEFTPGAITTARTVRGRRSEPRAKDVGAGSNHVDLMAWAHNLHPRQANH